MRAKLLIILLYSFSLFSCKEKEDRILYTLYLNSLSGGNKGDTLLIILDAKSEFTQKRMEIISNEKYIYYRREFDEDPNLIVNMGSYPDLGKLNINIKSLNNYDVLYDSLIPFERWFYLDYEKYFLIEKEDLVKANREGLHSLVFLEIAMNSHGII
jgi:hypothetical protein